MANNNNNQPLRRSRRGKQQNFGPGDRVEVVRDSNIAVGRLVRMISDDDDDQKVHWMVSFEGETSETKIPEKNIGRLVKEDDHQSEESNSSGRTRPNKKTLHVKKAQSSLQRTKIKLMPGKDQASGSAFRTTRSGRKQPLLAGIPPAVSKKKSKPKEDDGETVVKVKMLTGTLYLYRGLNPRAEFVRIV